MMVEVPVTDLSSAVRAMQYRPFLQTQKYAEQQTRANRVGAHPKMVLFSDKLVRVLAKKHGIPMFSHCIVRTPEEQKAAYVKGVSKTLKGAHLTGCATDVVHSVLAWDLDDKSWAMIGHIGHEVADSLGVKVVWGGPDFPQDTFDWDPAHWELIDYREDIVHGYVRKEGAWHLHVKAQAAPDANHGAGEGIASAGAGTGVPRGNRGADEAHAPGPRKVRTVMDILHDWIE